MTPSQSKGFFKIFWQVSFFQIFNSAAAFILNVLVTRLMGPVVFGNFYFYLSVAIATNILFDFGLSRTLLRYAPYHQARGEKGQQLAYYAAALDLKNWAGFVLLVLGAGVSWLWGGELRGYLIAGLVTGFIVSYCQYVAVVAQVEEKYPFYNLALSFNTLRLGLVGILAGMGVLGAGTLYGAFMLSPLVLAAIPAWFILRDLAGHPLPDKAEFYRRLIAFGRWMIIISIAETIYQRSDVILLRWLTDAEQTGYYSGALAFFGLVTMLPAYTATLIYPRFVKALGAGDPAGLSKAFRYSTDLIAFTAAPLAFGLWAVAPEVVDMVIGVRYHGALPVFGLLAGYSVFFSCFLNTGGMFFARDQPQYALWTVGAGLVLNVCGNLILVPRYGMLGTGISLCVAAGVSLFLAWWLIRRRFGILPNYSHLLAYLGAATLMPLLLRHDWGLALGISLTLKIVAGAALYFGVLGVLELWAGRGWIPREKHTVDA